jgi:hypothetical protein
MADEHQRNCVGAGRARLTIELGYCAIRIAYREMTRRAD